MKLPSTKYGIKRKDSRDKIRKDLSNQKSSSINHSRRGSNQRPSSQQKPKFK